MKFKPSLYLISLLFIVTVSSCHFVRSIIYMRPDHKDGNKFPKHYIESSEDEFEWQYADEQLDLSIIDVQYSNGKKTTLEAMLSYSKTNSFLIIKDDKIWAERYFGKYTEQSSNLVFSVSKSMIASIAGIALEEGLFNYTDPITMYLPELLENDSAFANITFQHIFEMKSGIKIRGKDAALFGDLGRTYYGNNFYRFMKTIEIEEEPGGKTIYNQTDAELVTFILRRVIDKPITEYFYEKIWNKIGATNAFWNTYKKDDIIRGYCCLNAKTKDFAKFGRLYLNNGTWNGEQIIPKAWVDFVVKTETSTEPNQNFTFHRFWFPSTDGVGDYTAQGFNGQFIYIYPAKNLIIIRFGKREFEKEIDWEMVFRSIAFTVL